MLVCHFDRIGNGFKPMQKQNRKSSWSPAVGLICGHFGGFPLNRIRKCTQLGFEGFISQNGGEIDPPIPEAAKPRRLLIPLGLNA